MSTSPQSHAVNSCASNRFKNCEVALHVPAHVRVTALYLLILQRSSRAGLSVEMQDACTLVWSLAQMGPPEQSGLALSLSSLLAHVLCQLKESRFRMKLLPQDLTNLITGSIPSPPPPPFCCPLAIRMLSIVSTPASGSACGPHSLFNIILPCLCSLHDLLLVWRTQGHAFYRQAHAFYLQGHAFYTSDK